MRKLGKMKHDECAPWCDHNPERHTEDCQDSYCDSYECWEKEHRVRLVAGPEVRFNTRESRANINMMTKQEKRTKRELDNTPQ